MDNTDKGSIFITYIMMHMTDMDILLLNPRPKNILW